MKHQRTIRRQFFTALLLSTVVSAGFFGYGALRNHSLEFNYLLWNLFLAWVPLLFALWLTKTLKTKVWSSWEALAASLLWILFLPNSFYMISDFIHLRDVMRVDVLYDALTFTSFIFTGVVLGFSSLYIVHSQLRRRYTQTTTIFAIAITLFICSIAIYVGRDLRWNSWDVIFNPGGLLFDLSDRLQHPNLYPQMLLTIGSFFVLLSNMYYLAWRNIELIRQNDAKLL